MASQATQDVGFKHQFVFIGYQSRTGEKHDENMQLGKFTWSSPAKGNRRECGTSRRYTRSSSITGQREYHRAPANGGNCGDGSADDCEAATTLPPP